MSRNTVKKYWNMSLFLPKVGRKRHNLLDHEDYLKQRWNEGEQNVKIFMQKLEKMALNTQSGLFMS